MGTTKLHRGSLGNTSLAGSVSSSGMTPTHHKQMKTQKSKKEKKQKLDKHNESIWNIDSVAVTETNLTFR